MLKKKADKKSVWVIRDQDEHKKTGTILIPVNDMINHPINGDDGAAVH